jgi:hypothetical protein
LLTFKADINQHRRLRERIEVVDEADQHVFRGEAALDVHQRQRIGTNIRVGGLECDDDGGEEPAQVGVVAVQRQHASRRGASALSESVEVRHWVKRCLAEAGRRGDQDQSSLRARVGQ